ncbi:leucine-rich repeat-containing protein kinase family protein [Alcaligenaceae bacterium C4P045]|nr:leucine-rich repeat-containing protein kinase family protein [Alcaligenaceae bacterium C4P045]
MPDNTPATDTLTQLRAGKLAGTRHLHITGGLTTFPHEILSLADTLEILDLSGNALTELPADFDRLHRLRILFLSFNAFDHIPDVLGRCPALTMLGMKANVIERVSEASLAPTLQWLTLTDNRIAALPAKIGDCSGLRKLLLAGNRLTALPDTLAQCRQIELIRLSANRFEVLPRWLPDLQRLTWLAVAGNPVFAAQEAAGRANDVPVHADWDHLTVKEKLGEGASGVIYRGEWAMASSAAPQPVAIKLFKGAVTSDGLPQNEMAACIAGSGHASLIPVHARIDNHPDDAQGLVMALIDPDLRNLADPPSFASCTRDVYAPEQRLTLAAALRVARGIADAARHLHARGIMHGDLYAHNILYADDGRAYLGDFGAASFYPAAEQAYERIEVRAFGLLLEELMALAQDEQLAAPDAFTAVAALQRQCASEHRDRRPSFAEIVTVLDDVGTSLSACR